MDMQSQTNWITTNLPKDTTAITSADGGTNK